MINIIILINIKISIWLIWFNGAFDLIFFMEDSLLPISKEMFISIKKENINSYYEVIAKVSLQTSRNWERVPSELFTRVVSKVLKVLGEPLRRFQKQQSKIRQCFSMKSRFLWPWITPISSSSTKSINSIKLFILLESTSKSIKSLLRWLTVR